MPYYHAISQTNLSSKRMSANQNIVLQVETEALRPRTWKHFYGPSFTRRAAKMPLLNNCANMKNIEHQIAELWCTQSQMCKIKSVWSCFNSRHIFGMEICGKYYNTREVWATLDRSDMSATWIQTLFWLYQVIPFPYVSVDPSYFITTNDQTKEVSKPCNSIIMWK